MTVSPDAFVPLATAASAPGKRADFCVLLAPTPEKARALHHVGAPPHLPTTPTPAQHAHGEPRVTLQRDGDFITGIRIACACGQVIDLKCSYSDPAAPSVAR